MLTTAPNTTPIHARTHIGRVREDNEDSYLAWQHPVEPTTMLLAVADGMGGLGGGQEASKVAIGLLEPVTQLIGQNRIADAQAAYAAVPGAAHEHLVRYGCSPTGRTPGTTLSALWIQGGYANILHIGDSRIYRFRGGVIECLTEDHGQIYELFVRHGQMTREELRTHPYNSVLSRCIGGTKQSPEAEMITRRAHSGDRFLVCSDGLTDMVSEADIKALVRSQAETNALADQLLGAALAAGGRDNITLLLADVP